MGSRVPPASLVPGRAHRSANAPVSRRRTGVRKAVGALAVVPKTRTRLGGARPAPRSCGRLGEAQGLPRRRAPLPIPTWLLRDMAPTLLSAAGVTSCGSEAGLGAAVAAQKSQSRVCRREPKRRAHRVRTPPIRRAVCGDKGLQDALRGLTGGVEHGRAYWAVRDVNPKRLEIFPFDLTPRTAIVRAFPCRGRLSEGETLTELQGCRVVFSVKLRKTYPHPILYFFALRGPPQAPQGPRRDPETSRRTPGPPPPS